MAYGKKYFLNFNDYSGNTYVVNLLKKDYISSSSEIERFPVSPVTHTYRGGRDSINNVIAGSEVNLNFYVTPDENNRYDEIFESDYKDWRLDILKTGLISDGYGYDSTVQSINLTEDDSNGGKLWSQTNTPNDNIIYGLNLTSTGNNYTLRWTNPSFNFTPLSYKILIKTDSPFNPYEPDIAINGSSINSYTWNNIGEYPAPYSFAVAPCSNTGGVNPHEFSATLFADIENMNVPYNVSASVFGNSIKITWDNPTYGVIVQSFALNRLRLVGGVWTEGTLLTFNNGGTATSYTDTNIGAAHSSATYKYQVAIATGTDGFGRQSFSDFSSSLTINNTNIKPNITTNALNTTVYFGGSKIQPVIYVSGGSGTFNLDYNWDIGGSNHDEIVSVTANETQFAQNLTDRFTVRGDSFNFSLDANTSLYNLYGTTSRSYSSPSVSGSGKVSGVSISGSGAGSSLTIGWSSYSDASAVTGYGYRVGRFLSSDFSTIVYFTVSGMGSTSYVDNISALAAGNYTYFVQAISIANPTAEPEPNIYICPTYPDMPTINIT